MGNTVPCINPTHGVSNHIAGSQAAVECAASRGGASSSSRVTASVPSASSSVPVVRSADLGYSTVAELKADPNFTGSTHLSIKAESGDRAVIVLRKNETRFTDAEGLHEDAVRNGVTDAWGGDTQTLADGRLLWVSEPVEGKRVIDPTDSIGALYRELEVKYDAHSGEGPYRLETLGTISAPFDPDTATAEQSWNNGGGWDRGYDDPKNSTLYGSINGLPTAIYSEGGKSAAFVIVTNPEDADSENYQPVGSMLAFDLKGGLDLNDLGVESFDDLKTHADRSFQINPYGGETWRNDGGPRWSFELDDEGDPTDPDVEFIDRATIKFLSQPVSDSDAPIGRRWAVNGVYGRAIPTSDWS